MQKANVENVTESAPRPGSRRFVALGVSVVIMVLAVGAVFWWWRDRSDCDLRLGQTCITLERVSTPAAQDRGLSGRHNLPDDRAMLFVYDRPEAGCFWMKDMNFAIDIIWLDANKRIVTIADAVSPETYPHNFCPTDAAQYVLEMPAGSATRYDLAVGRQLQF